ncbi:MAG TPA: aminoacyl-tRNA hydrolase [Syntrophomonadaceae bacterium]|nr:aminoacyl-tRNA hydrolase [Syntrophomonadaceae bacterium]
MKIVVGLGNPGPNYKDTRHNVGFMVVEELARRHSVERQEQKFDAIIAHTHINQEKVLLIKPLTYMNLSGRAVQAVVRFFKADLDELMIIYDDMDLPVGTLRLRPQGGTGGHKGLMSIQQSLGTQDFPRLRIGIGRPHYHDPVDWVLSKFQREEKELITAAINQAADAIESWVNQGLDQAMNTYNQ